MVLPQVMSATGHLGEIHKLLGRLYTYHISHFADMSWVFSWNTPRNTYHPLYIFRTSFKFNVCEKINYEILSPFWENAGFGTKWCKTWKNDKKKCAKYPAIYFSFFSFREHFIFREKCTAEPALGQLYDYPISHLTDILQMFSRNTQKYRVIHLKCPKRQVLRRVKDAFNPPTKFIMWLGRHREIHGYFFLAQSVQFWMRYITSKTKNGFDNTSTHFHCGRIFEI